MNDNAMANRKVFLTVEVANAIRNYNAFMDAKGGAYSYEGVLRSPRSMERDGAKATIESHDSDHMAGAFACHI